MKTVVSFTAVLGLLLTAAHADWPTWRGAQRDGICQDTGLIGSFSDKGPPLLWKIEGLGKGMASIAHVDGKLFTMGRNAGETHLLCYDSATQKQVWSLTTAKKGDEPNSTPTVADGRVYSLDRAGNVTCADGSHSVRGEGVARDPSLRVGGCETGGCRSDRG